MKTVSQFMDEEHAILNRLWQEFLLEDNNIEQAQALFQKFSKYLEQHIILEDTILFPRFNEHLGFNSGEGPVAVLVRDHENIKKLLKDIELAGEVRDLSQVILIGDNLKRLLDKHLERESEMGYPVCDTFITPDEWQKLVERAYEDNGFMVFF